jgi:hypothetical protein
MDVIARVRVRAIAWDHFLRHLTSSVSAETLRLRTRNPLISPSASKARR